MFELNDTHLMIQDMFRQYMMNEIEPIIDDIEDGKIPLFDPLRKMVETLGIRSQMDALDLSKPLRTESREKREANPDDPMEGMEVIAGNLLVKEMSRVSPSFAFGFGVSAGLFAGNIMRRGTPEQIQNYAIPALKGDLIGAWALTEPGAGSDALGGMKTRAVKDGDHYVLNGSKTFITNAPIGDAFLVYAKYQLDSGQDSVQAFIVDRKCPGLSTGKPFKKMGVRGSPTGEVFFDDCRVPLGNILGAAITGFALLPAIGLQKSVALLAALSLANAAWGLYPGVAGRRVLAAIPRTAVIVCGIVLGVAVLLIWTPQPLVGNGTQQSRETLYYKEGLVATTLVYRDASDHRKQSMAVDRIKIGDSYGDVDMKQQGLAHFPFLLMPERSPRTILSIGPGTGILVGETAKHPSVQTLDCVEIAPTVIEGARLFDELLAMQRRVAVIGDVRGVGSYQGSPDLLFLCFATAEATARCQPVDQLVAGDDDRASVNQWQMDIYFVWLLAQMKHWLIINPQPVLDVENDKEFMIVDVEFGFMIPQLPGASTWIRPGAGVGSERPFDWTFEFGFKWIWR